MNLPLELSLAAARQGSSNQSLRESAGTGLVVYYDAACRIGDGVFVLINEGDQSKQGRCLNARGMEY